jgi:hypothetical protein
MERRHRHNLRWQGLHKPANPYVLVNYSGHLSTRTNPMVKGQGAPYYPLWFSYNEAAVLLQR